MGGPVIRPPYGGKKPLCCALNACGDYLFIYLFLTFLPFSEKKGKYSHSSSHHFQKGASEEKVYVLMPAQLSPEVHSTGVHETADQQLGGCSPQRRPASSSVSSSSFPFLMTDISVVKGRSVVLQAEPKSFWILPKDRDVFLFFLQSKHFSSFSTVDMFLCLS